MKKRNLMEIGLKILGIGLFIKCFEKIVTLLLLLTSQGKQLYSLYNLSTMGFLMIGFQIVIYFIVSVIFIKKTDLVLDKLHLSQEAKNIQFERRIVFEVILIYYGLSGLISGVLWLISGQFSDFVNDFLYVFSTLISILMIIKSPILAAFIDKKLPKNILSDR